MMDNKQCIIITSIYPPTKAVECFSGLDEWYTIVVGDKKTPANWQCKNSFFLSTDDQTKLGYRIGNLLPYNHYSRKMIGYIYAIKSGAEIIAETDDDNLPKINWGFPKFKGNYLTSEEDLGFVNIYKSFTNMHIWPRGFPLSLIKSNKSTLQKKQLSEKIMNVGVWQGLADNDPDVDAIYRLTNNQICYFDDHEPIVLGKGTLSPFNSQNTAFCKELFPLMYLPAFVTFRFTDILRGLVAQPIMWTKGYYLGFTKATVLHERSPHNYLSDFESEIPCYLMAEKAIDVVSKTVNAEYSVAENLYLAYDALFKNGIVTKQEVELVSLWLNDIGLS